MANVNATDGFFVDPRFDAAALHLGLAPEVVRLRCLELYSWQTEQYTDEAPTHDVPAAVVIGKLKHLGAPAALVAAGLAEERDGGLLYIKGSRGRIEWLAGRRGDRQSERRGGGLKRVDGAARDERGRLLPRSPAGQGAGQEPPAVTSSPSSSVQLAGDSVQLAGDSGPARSPAAPANMGSGIWDLKEEGEGEGATPPRTPPPLKLLGGSDPGPGSKPRRSRPAPKPVETPIPADFAPGAAAQALAAELRLDLDDQVRRWRDKAAAKGWTWVDHQAALRTWLRNAAEFRERDRAVPSSTNRYPNRSTSTLVEPEFKPL